MERIPPEQPPNKAGLADAPNEDPAWKAEAFDDTVLPGGKDFSTPRDIQTCAVLSLSVFDQLKTTEPRLVIPGSEPTKSRLNFSAPSQPMEPTLMVDLRSPCKEKEVQGIIYPLASSKLEATGPPSVVKSYTYDFTNSNHPYVGTLEATKNPCKNFLQCDSTVLGQADLCSSQGHHLFSSTPGAVPDNLCLGAEV